MRTRSREGVRAVAPTDGVGERLPREWFARDAATVARELLGRRLVRADAGGQRVSGHIVETEAYLGVPDRASHAHGGRRTARNEAMYARAGTAYVYFTYGMHFCVNVVCATEGDPQAVLIRALRPHEGLDAMRTRRGRAGASEVRLCRGPACVCQALAIDRALNGHDLAKDRALWIEAGSPIPASRVGRSPRVGVEYAGAWAARRLRWFVRGDPHVSGPRRTEASTRGWWSARRSQS